MPLRDFALFLKYFQALKLPLGLMVVKRPESDFRFLLNQQQFCNELLSLNSHFDSGTRVYCRLLFLLLRNKNSPNMITAYNISKCDLSERDDLLASLSWLV